MFEIKNTFSFNKEKLTDGNEYDYVTRTSNNQGILQSTGFVNARNLNEAGIWSLGLLQMDFFYRQRQWYAGQFVRKIIPKIKLTQNSILFFTTLLNSQKNILLSVLVRDVDKTFKNLKIKLPVTASGEIDFDFMESFVAELEAERVRKIKEYLKATGLTDATLTQAEQKAIEAIGGGYELNSKTWKEFRIGDLFDIVGTKSLDSNAVDFVENGINFVGRTFENNGIQGKIEKQKFEPNEPFTITATVIGNYKYVKYQKEPYYCSQNINKLTPKTIFIKWSEKIAIFLMTNIWRFVSIYDGQQGGYKLDDIKNHKIKLPITASGEIDFEFMNNFIKAIEKLVIKDVVLYTDNKIKATKSIASSNQ